MNCYLIFSVVFILNLNNVMIARFQPVPKSLHSFQNDDETTVTPDPISSKISKKLILVYKQLRYFEESPHYEAAVQAVEDIAKDAAELASSEKKLAIETHEKYIYMSLIDMKNVTMNFINQCYPPWIRRSEANLPLNEKILSTVLLNIENPRVLRLKKILIENKICESKFVKDLQRFLSMRNEKAHLEISSGERELKSISDQTVLEFLIGDKPDLSSEASDITTSKPINIEIRRSVNDRRTRSSRTNV
ncbi:uncharacterized protein LOC135834538 isoform X2 [Planococcus citri]|uniref:uncharacterized protein LOC135834538 isoform X2 n=1 Tax=Planococcus citri TaxID=170843 RepID=UPI0031F96C44